MPKKVVLAYSGGLDTSIIVPWLMGNYSYDVIAMEGADAVAHGCTGKGNDQVRFEHAYQALAPELKIIAPWREWDLQSREDCLDYAEKRNIPVSASRTKIHSRDKNLWHLSHEGGELEDPANSPLDSTWQMSVSPEAAPDRATEVELGFEQGTPVSVNGKKLDPVSIVEM